MNFFTFYFNKHMKPLFVIFLLVSSVYLNAAEVILCKTIKKGLPIETQTTWDAKKDNICIVFNHDKPLQKNAVYKLSIARRVEKYYFWRFSNRDIFVKKGQSQIVTHSVIQEPGDYIISIIDEKGYILAEQSCTIK